MRLAFGSSYRSDSKTDNLWPGKTVRVFKSDLITARGRNLFIQQQAGSNLYWRAHMFRRTFLALTSVAALTSATFAFAGGHTKDIVDTAVDAGSFTNLVAAVQAAGLVDTLKGEGPFTVFAPTDEAFAALPEGTVEDLLKPENKDKLIAILTYHVVSGKVMSTDLSNNTMAPTVQGSDVKIMTEGGVTVNGAKVISADIEASNGVIHVIDTVLIPSM